MVRTNKLHLAPPYPVEQTISGLGENLRLARIRRSLTIAEAAQRIGTGPRAVMDAEKGKPSTAIAVYAALLWLYDQLHELEDVGDPNNDSEGRAIENSKRRVRVRRTKGLDNDF